jgi:hypothetical protein
MPETDQPCNRGRQDDVDDSGYNIDSRTVEDQHHRSEDRQTDRQLDDQDPDVAERCRTPRRADRGLRAGRRTCSGGARELLDLCALARVVPFPAGMPGDSSLVSAAMLQLAATRPDLPLGTAIPPGGRLVDVVESDLIALCTPAWSALLPTSLVRYDALAGLDRTVGLAVTVAASGVSL